MGLSRFVLFSFEERERGEKETDRQTEQQTPQQR